MFRCPFSTPFNLKCLGTLQKPYQLQILNQKNVNEFPLKSDILWFKYTKIIKGNSTEKN